MSDKGRSNLVVNERGPDVNWFAGGQNLFKHRQWYRSKNHVEEKFDLTPEQAGLAYGTTHVFEIDKRGDVLFDSELIKTRGALTQTGGTFVRFSDYEAYRDIKEVRVIYNNKIAHRVTGERLLRYVMEENTQDERDSIAALTLGEKTAAERNTLAASGATTVVKLRFPWRKFFKGIAMIALPNKIRVEVEFNALQDICEFDGSSPACTLSALKLRCHFVHLKQEDRNALYQQVNMGKGIIFKGNSVEFHQKEPIVAPGVSGGFYSYRLRLRNIRNAVYELTGIIRQQRFVDVGSTRNLLSHEYPSRWRLEDNNTAVTDTVEFVDSAAGFNFGEYKDNTEAHPNHKKGMKYLKMFFCPKQYIEKSEDDCYGSRNISKYNNPEIVIEWDSFPDTNNRYLELEGEIHNLWIQNKGDFRRYLL